ncbi:hypothetical protein O3U67_15910 [Brevundimonas diminuta]|uniref:hypothetical protein n=1 Tax=Brevundimonas diminuta TaxID=293 RepID=UPI0022AF8B82|nr:hypothetical protein [Brevundimonas diminuta]MCZ4109576.1 hypothetical protein [Brevundimonas diminuta]
MAYPFLKLEQAAHSRRRDPPLAQPFDRAQVALTYGCPERRERERPVGVKKIERFTERERFLVAPVGGGWAALNARRRISALDARDFFWV